MTDTITSSRKVDRVMYVCTDCHDAGQEICCYADRRDLGVMPDGRWLCENCLSELPEKATKGLKCPPAYAPAEQGTHDDGIDLALTQLCKFLSVDQKSVTWDAATETVEGDVSAVIGNILRAKFGEDWGPDETSVGDKRRSGSVDSAPLAQSVEPPLSVQDVQQEFYVWWAANQEDPAHGMITQNCALATWKGAYDKYVRNASSPLTSKDRS